jgi:predicted DNA binding protein/ActR/RegA family two-component response regulator
VLLIDDDETWVRTQRRLLERSHDGLTVSTATSFEAAQRALVDTQETPDCVVCDYQLGDGTGVELLVDLRSTEPELPFILVTGEGDEGVASDAISAQVTDYINKLHLSQQPTRLAKRIESAVSAHRTRRQLARERQSKKALLEMVTASTTRSELGDTICQYLVDTHDYACAWIAVLDDDGGVVPLSTAGSTDYIETAITPGRRPTDSTEPTLAALAETEPVVRSLTAGGMATDQSTNSNPSTNGDSSADSNLSTDGEPTAAEGWQAVAVDHGLRSVAAIPIRHNEICFGVLTVYSRDESWLSDRQQALLTDAAETVGYVFQTTAWKRTLLSSTAATVEFELSDRRQPLLALAAALPEGARLQTRMVIPRNNREVLYVATVDGVTEAELAVAVESTESVGSVELYRTGDELRCGLVAASPVPESSLADLGISFVRTVVEAGHVRVTAVVGAETTVQQCVDVLRDLYGTESVTTLWTTADHASVSETDAVGELTDRQRQVLELAVEAGYFERPRHNNTGELAESLDISRSTFTQHLRAAQRKLFEAGIHEQ